MIRAALSQAGASLAVLAARLGVRRTVTEENLAAAFPKLEETKRKKLLLAAYDNLGRVFAELVYLRFAPKSQIQSALEITNAELVNKAVSEGGGVILLSAHLANWEWMALATGLRLDMPLHIIVKNQKDAFVERFLNRMRTRFGNKVINAGDVRGVFRVLLEGKIVAMLADQAAPGYSIRVPFFGRLVPTFEGPARMALRTGARLLFADCTRTTGGSYKMTFREVSTEGLSENPAAAELELTNRHTQLLERVIRANPEFWLWQHRRWKNAEPIAS